MKQVFEQKEMMGNFHYFRIPCHRWKKNKVQQFLVHYAESTIKFSTFTEH